MRTELLKLPTQSIIVDSKIRIFVKISADGKKPDVNRLVGLLGEHKKEYTSVQLQHAAKEWWTNVSG